MPSSCAGLNFVPGGPAWEQRMENVKELMGSAWVRGMTVIALGLAGFLLAGTVAGQALPKRRDSIVWRDKGVKDTAIGPEGKTRRDSVVQDSAVNNFFWGDGDTAALRKDTSRWVKTLPEVRVLGHKNFMTVEADKKVFAVEGMSGVSSGTAGDVLQQVPMVDVDKDGNVSQRGKAANVLIDGKPSTFSDIRTALQVILASGIEKVEVMTNPSAKYDAEGQGGIINIVLKKNQATGFHGVLNLDAATQREEHAGTDFNFRHKGINIFGNFNYHARTTTGEGNSQQHFLGDSAEYVEQEDRRRMENRDVDARMGVDYALNERTTLTMTGNFSDHKTTKTDALVMDSGPDAKSLLPYGYGDNEVRTRVFNESGGLDFSHKFRKEAELLTASGQFSTEATRSDADLLTAGDVPGAGWRRNAGNQQADLLLSQIDFSDPVGKHGKLEAGWKSTVRNDRNTVGGALFDSAVAGFAYNTALSSRFRYREQVHAGYGMFADGLGKYEYKIGVRGELAVLDGASALQPAAFHRILFNLFPSLYLSRQLPEGQSIGLSYSTRITRPAFMDLLPYVNVSNPLNHTAGNPFLSPAYTQSGELNYCRSFGKGSQFINVGVYYSATHNGIQAVTIRDTGGVTLTRPENVPVSRSAGADLIYRVNVLKILHLTATLDGSYTAYGHSFYTVYKRVGLWSGTLRLNGEVDMPGRLALMAHGELSSPQALPQGYSNHNKGIDLELRRVFWHSRLTTALIVSDVLNDRREWSHVVTPEFIQDESSKENGRMLHLHLSYRL